MKTLIIILIIIIIVVAWYLFRPEKSFISKRVNEVFPDVNETDSSSKSAIKFCTQETLMAWLTTLLVPQQSMNYQLVKESSDSPILKYQTDLMFTFI